MRSRSSAYALFGIHCVAYAVFLYVDYSFYEGGRDFVLSDTLVWGFSLILPLLISLIPWSMILLFKRDGAKKWLYWSVAVLSAVGVVISSLAAYLAWWSTTR